MREIGMLRKLFKFTFSCLMILVLSSQVCRGQIDDIRIVIDISGSMLKTDPQNLRQPALRMVSGLIPSGATAGVWTFGRYTNMEVKWAKVNESWRKSAAKGALAIHSRGQFTNIDGALIRASSGWENPDPDTRRNLILLTDGKIDVSKDAQKNRESRATLISNTIPQLVKNGVTVHTIALSRFTDEVLLKRIAFETGGSFEIAQSADQLQRVFLKMFERATVPDMVPLTDNQFTIDKSINEMTLLVFNKSGNKIGLTAPDKTTLSLDKHAAHVKWLHDQGYDLITVSKPQPGVWLLDAEIDPDNRVMIVTDLKLVVDNIPAYLMPNNNINLKVELHNEGKKISKNSFLKFVNFYVDHTDSKRVNKLPLELKKSREIADKGIYLQTIAGPLTEGLHDIEVHADGSTFSRSKKYTVKVYWPVEVDIAETDKPGIYELSLIPHDEYIKPETANISVSLEMPDKQLEPQVVVMQTEGWGAQLNATQQNGPHRVLIKIEAKTHDGQTVAYDLPAYPIEGVKQKGMEDTTAQVIEIDKSVIEESVANEETIPDTELEPDADPANDLFYNIMMISIANVIIIILGLGIFWFVRKSKQKDAISLMDEEKDGEAGEVIK
jgi:uncharacterized protein (TIGR03503 family)